MNNGITCSACVAVPAECVRGTAAGGHVVVMGASGRALACSTDGGFYTRTGY